MEYPTELYMTMPEVERLVAEEIKHATEKHCGGVPANRDSFVRILGEEYGEVCKAINQRRHTLVLRKEVIQVMAVCSMYLQGNLRDSDK